MPQQSQFAFPRPTPVVLRVMIALGALWLLFAIATNIAQSGFVDGVYGELELHPSEVVPGLHLWQIATYAWLHDLNGLSHILLNCLGLYFLGPMLERRWGGGNFLRFYVVTGIIAGAFSVLVGVLFGGRWDVPIVGASGALLGLVAAYSVIFPNAQFLLFFVVPVRARYLIWIALGLDILFFIANPRGNVAIQTHFGGALAGWLLVTGNWRPGIFMPKLKRLFSGGPRQPPPRGGGNLRVLPGGRNRNDLN